VALGASLAERDLEDGLAERIDQDLDAKFDPGRGGQHGLVDRVERAVADRHAPQAVDRGPRDGQHGLDARRCRGFTPRAGERHFDPRTASRRRQHVAFSGSLRGRNRRRRCLDGTAAGIDMDEDRGDREHAEAQCEIEAQVAREPGARRVLAGEQRGHDAVAVVGRDRDQRQQQPGLGRQPQPVFAEPAAREPVRDDRRRRRDEDGKRRDPERREAAREEPGGARVGALRRGEQRHEGAEPDEGRRHVHREGGRQERRVRRARGMPGERRTDARERQRGSGGEAALRRDGDRGRADRGDQHDGRIRRRGRDRDAPDFGGEDVARERGVERPGPGDAGPKNGRDGRDRKARDERARDAPRVADPRQKEDAADPDRKGGIADEADKHRSRLPIAAAMRVIVVVVVVVVVSVAGGGRHIADDERDRPRNRVRIGRDDAIRDDIGAVGQVARHGEDEDFARGALEAVAARDGPAVRVDEPQAQRRHRLVEAQLDRGRGGGKPRAVGRDRGGQPRMRVRAPGRKAEHEQRAGEEDADCQGRGVRRSDGAGYL